MIFSCKKIALQKSKKLHHPPSFSCIIWPRNHSDTGCEQLHEGLQEGGRPIDNSKTENSSSKEQLGGKTWPRTWSSSWLGTFQPFFEMGNFGFIALRTRVSLCWAAIPSCIVHVPCFWRDELQICKQEKDLEDQKLRSNLLLGARNAPWFQISKTGLKNWKKLLFYCMVGLLLSALSSWSEDAWASPWDFSIWHHRLCGF